MTVLFLVSCNMLSIICYYEQRIYVVEWDSTAGRDIQVSSAGFAKNSAQGNDLKQLFVQNAKETTQNVLRR